jgi:hypothetical protein
MANLDESAAAGYDWGAEGVYRIEKSDPVEGGPDGISNRQAEQLARRTRNLHERLAQVEGDGWVSTDRIAPLAVVARNIANDSITRMKLDLSLREEIRYRPFFARVVIFWQENSVGMLNQSAPRVFNDNGLYFNVGDSDATLALPLVLDLSGYVELDSIQISCAHFKIIPGISPIIEKSFIVFQYRRSTGFLRRLERL